MNNTALIKYDPLSLLLVFTKVNMQVKNWDPYLTLLTKEKATDAIATHPQFYMNIISIVKGTLTCIYTYHLQMCHFPMMLSLSACRSHYLDLQLFLNAFYAILQKN